MIFSAAAGTAAAQSRADIKTGPVVCFQKIHLYRLYIFQKLLVDHKTQSVFFKLLIVFFRLIQSHAQGGAGSAAFRNNDANGRYRLFAALKKLPDHLGSFVSYFEHRSSPNFYNILNTQQTGVK